MREDTISGALRLPRALLRGARRYHHLPIAKDDLIDIKALAADSFRNGRQHPAVANIEYK